MRVCPPSGQPPAFGVLSASMRNGATRSSPLAVPMAAGSRLNQVSLAGSLAGVKVPACSGVRSSPVTVTKIADPTPIPQPTFNLDDGSGTGGAGTVETVKPVPPTLVDPMIDQRYAGLFQPVFPPDEQRAGRGGRVVVRVLVGVDGRVKDIEQVSATSESFFAVTRKRALEKWRFKPGTRDGIPVEAWRTIAVSFVLNEAE